METHFYKSNVLSAENPKLSIRSSAAHIEHVSMRFSIEMPSVRDNVSPSCSRSLSPKSAIMQTMIILMISDKRYSYLLLVCKEKS